MYDVAESDFHGLKALLLNFLDGEGDFDSSGLSECIINECRSVQSLIKTGEDEGPLGLIALLNHQRYAHTRYYYYYLKEQITNNRKKNQKRRGT